MTRVKKARSKVSRELAPVAFSLDDIVTGSDPVGIVVGWNKVLKTSTVTLPRK